MSKFLKNFLGFTLMTTLFLSGLGYSVDQGLKKSGLDNFPEWSAIERGEINADLIVAGSSRAWVHVSPFILDTALRMNTFNLGLDGHDFKTQYMRFQFYQEKNRNPSYIIHCLDIFMLETKKELYMPEQFAPYLSEPIIKDGIKDYKGFTFIDYYNPFTKYLFRTKYIAKGLLEFFGLKHFESGKYKGYQGKDRPWDSKFDRAKAENPRGWNVSVNSTLVELFDSYVAECLKKKIKIIMVYPPEYIEGQNLIKNRPMIMEIYERISRKYDILFLDYSTDQMSSNKGNFYNSQHLNRRAAETFSVKLSQDVKPYIEKQ